MRKLLMLITAVIFVTALPLFLVVVTPAMAVNLEYNVKVKVNGELIQFPDQQPFIDNTVNRTFVPLRFVSQALGGIVDWDNDIRTATVDRAGVHIEMPIGSDQPLVNGQGMTIDAPARQINARTMVPLRFVSEALGAKVEWAQKTRTVIISLSGTAVKDNEPFNEAATFTISDLYPPTIFPLCFTGPGKWIVEPVQLDSESKMNALNAFQSAIQPISQRLKPFPMFINNNWIAPSVVISPMFIIEHGRPGKTTAWYDSEYNSIVLTWAVLQVGKAAIQHAFAHEFGHWVWYHIMTDEEKQEYRNLVGEPNKRRDQELIDTYGIDAELLIQEWFAEDFRLYACNVQECSEIRSKLGTSRGDPDKLKRYFARFVAEKTNAI